MQPLYFIEHAGRRSKWFLELDRDDNSRASVIDAIRTGNAVPVKILEVIEPCADFPFGYVTDVTAELLAEANELEAA